MPCLKRQFSINLILERSEKTKHGIRLNFSSDNHALKSLKRPGLIIETIDLVEVSDGGVIHSTTF